MHKLVSNLDQTDQDYLDQVRYALAFLSEDVESYNVDGEKKQVELSLKPGADENEVRTRLDQILIRYQKTEFGMKSVIDFEQKRDLPEIDAWSSQRVRLEGR